MINFHRQNNRQLVPRFLPASVTAAMVPDDLRPNQWLGSALSVPELNKRLFTWFSEPTIPHAIDLVVGAYIVGQSDHPEVQRAADKIVAESSGDGGPQFDIARSVLERSPDAKVAALVTVAEVRRRLAQLKVSSRLSPRDAFLHLELAYNYTLLAQLRQAGRHMAIAVAEGRGNPHVLRAAARFYLHAYHDPDRSLHLLRRRLRQGVEPTVLSAEVAICSAFNQTSRNAKRAQRLVDAFDSHPWHLSELSATVAMLEFRSGATRKAKKALAKALRCPTENTVAQLRWVQDRMGHGAELEPQAAPQANFEGEMIRDLNAGQYDRALSNAVAWSRFEPYSVRPSVTGSFLAMSMFEEFELASSLCAAALHSNPRSVALLNNHAAASALSGDIVAARRSLERMQASGLRGTDRHVFMATSGLVAFKSGNVDEGEALYQAAIGGFEAAKDDERASLASLFLEVARADAGDGIAAGESLAPVLARAEESRWGDTWMARRLRDQLQ